MSSALGAVMAALNRREEGDAKEPPLRAAVLPPCWERNAGAEDAKELQKVEAAAPRFDPVVVAEEDCIQELKGVTTRDELMNVLGKYLGVDAGSGKVEITADFDGWVAVVTCLRMRLYNFVKKYAHRFSRKLVVVTLRCTMRVNCWEPIFAFLECGMVSGNETPDVVDWMVNHGNVGALCVCLNKVKDLRPSHRRDILRVFLSDDEKLERWFFILREVYREVVLCVMDEAAKVKGFEMVTKRVMGFRRLSFLNGKGREAISRNGAFKQWIKAFENPDCWMTHEAHRTWMHAHTTVWKPFAIPDAGVMVDGRNVRELRYHTLLMRGSTGMVNLKAASDTAVDMAAAFDFFSAWELCLNVFVSAGVDEAVLSMLVSELDNREVFKMVHFLNKWLDKYANKVIPLHQARLEAARRFVPSHFSVVQWLASIVEDRFASFVLSGGLKSELLVSRGLVNSLVEQAKLVSLDGVTKHLLDGCGLPAATPSSGASDHVIEYLEM